MMFRASRVVPLHTFRELRDAIFINANSTFPVNKRASLITAFKRSVAADYSIFKAKFCDLSSSPISVHMRPVGKSEGSYLDAHRENVSEVELLRFSYL